MSNFFRETILTPDFAVRLTGWTLFGISVLGVAYNAEQAAEHYVQMQTAQDSMDAHQSEGQRQEDLKNWGAAHEESASEMDDRATASHENLLGLESGLRALGCSFVAAGGAMTVRVANRRPPELPEAPQVAEIL